MAQTPGVVFDGAIVSTVGRRTGYAVSILLNGLFLFIANSLLAWGWPPWLTEDFASVLPVLNTAIIVGVLVNAVYLVYDPPWAKAVGDIVTTAMSLAVGVRMWQVFPFDFTGYEWPWDTILRWMIGLGIFGTSVALLVNIVKLAMIALGIEAPSGTTDPGPGRRRTHPPGEPESNL